MRPRIVPALSPSLCILSAVGKTGLLRLWDVTFWTERLKEEKCLDHDLKSQWFPIVSYFQSLTGEFRTVGLVASNSKPLSYLVFQGWL